MVILLDIDGVLVTTPPWNPVETDSDGFVRFNPRAASNLARIIESTNSSIVLTTTHRINYSIEEWTKLLFKRGINPSSIAKVNDLKTLNRSTSRADEIKEWIDKNGEIGQFVVIDDDTSIHGLPEKIKLNCVITKPLIGLDEESTEKAIKILMKK